MQGFDVRYARLFYRDGTVVKRENFYWRYAPTNRGYQSNDLNL